MPPTPHSIQPHASQRLLPGALRPVCVLLLALLFLLLPAAAFALCICGYGDGRFTVDQPIAIDGNMSDWGAVLADTDNNVCDGAIDQNGTIYQPQPDLDAPVQSTGRDLVHFAYTWNGSEVLTYTERAASTSNTQNFIYYADTNNDGLMQTGERVVVAMWQGNNRSVDLFVGSYVEATPGGDAMVDANGFADGYNLPGTAINFPPPGKPDYSGRWGSSDGLKMEWSLPWAVLGLPPRTAFTFHVSSTNATPQAASFPDQVDDNMGGCGGGPASTQYADLAFIPDRVLLASAGTTIHAAHALVNTGNGTDTFALSSVVSGPYAPAIAYYLDLGTVGQYDAGTDIPLADTDGDGSIDSGPLPSGETVNLLIAFSLPGDAAGIITVTTTATSGYDPNVTGTVSDEIRVLRPTLTIMKSADRAAAAPGEIITYTVTVLNAGSEAAAAVSLTDDLSPYTAWGLDYDGDGTPGDSFSFSPGSSGLTLGTPEFFDAEGSYVPVPGGGGAPPGYDGNVTEWRLPMTGSMAVGGSFILRYKVLVK